MPKRVVGFFDTIQDAEAVVRDLRSAGISETDISFAGRNPDAATMEANEYIAEGHSEAAEGAAFGATGGTVVGGLTGLLVGLGALAIPGVGPVIAAGSLATALGSAALGAGIGAATGGLLGALVGAGIPEEDANFYAEGIRRGGALVMAQVDDTMVDTVLDIMERHNVVDVDERSSQYRSEGWSRYDDTAGAYAGDRSSTTTETGYRGTGDTDTMPDRDDYNRSSKVGTAGGAAAGAATGAALGSAGGPVGTVVGGVAGAVTGGGVGAAGDAAGVEASERERGSTSSDDTSTATGGTGYGGTSDVGGSSASAYGSASDVGGTGTSGYGSTSDVGGTGTSGYGSASDAGGSGTSGYGSTGTSAYGTAGGMNEDADTSPSSPLGSMTPGANMLGTTETTDATYGSTGRSSLEGADTSAYATQEFDTATTGDADNIPGGDDYARSSKMGTAGGAFAGAATGAAIGSAGGPIGTIIGGVAGAVTGAAVGAAGDAAGVEASDDDRGGTTSDTGTSAYGATGAMSSDTGMADTSAAGTPGGTAYGSATDLGDQSAQEHSSGSYGAAGTGTTGSAGAHGGTSLNQDEDADRRDPATNF